MKVFYGRFLPIARKDHPFHTGWDIDGVLNALSLMPRPSHNLDALKTNLLPLFRFFMVAHEIIVELVAKYQLLVTPGWLFKNLFVHAIDHNESMIWLGKIPRLWSLDGTGSVRSCLYSRCSSSYWMKPHMNVFEPEREREFTSNNQFYADLYNEMEKIDTGRARTMITSCSF